MAKMFNKAKNVDDLFRELGRKKPEGSLLDEFRRYATKETMPRIANKYIDLVKANVVRAKQFIFDEQSSEIMADFIREAPELVFKNEEFAIPHFDASYYEFDADLFLAAFGRPQTGTGETRDWRVGYLIVDNLMFVISKTFEKHSSPGFLLYAIQMGPSKIGGKAMPLSRRMAAQLMLGSTSEDLPMQMRNDIVEHYQYINISDGIEDKHLMPTMPDGAGDLRNVITMILFLYQSKKVIDITDVAPSRGFIKGKQVAYMAKSVVTIHLNEVKTIRKHILANKRDSPKRHWCIPFYRTVGGSRECDHSWEQYKDERWKCEKCDAKRARIKSYEKGDASKGYVMKHYEVTA